MSFIPLLLDFMLEKEYVTAHIGSRDGMVDTLPPISVRMVSARLVGRQLVFHFGPARLAPETHCHVSFKENGRVMGNVSLPLRVGQFITLYCKIYDGKELSFDGACIRGAYMAEPHDWPRLTPKRAARKLRYRGMSTKHVQPDPSPPPTPTAPRQRLTYTSNAALGCEDHIGLGDTDICVSTSDRICFDCPRGRPT